MAGISISAIVGDNGVIVKARKASNETTKAQIQEELQLKIIDLQIEKEKTGEKITNSDIEGALGELNGIEIDSSGKNVEGEYKEHGYKVDDNYNVIVTDKLTGDKPVGRAEIITRGDNLEEVEIQVTGYLKDGEIELIESLNGAKLLEKKNNGEYIFVVSDNLTYTFRIKGSNGRNLTVNCSVDNAIPIRDDLLTAVEKIKSNGIKKVKILGKVNTEASEEEIIYSLNVIRHEGNLILDGINPVDGATLTGTTYLFGNLNTDIRTNIVVLKVEGNLIINSNVGVTTVASGLYGTKGLIIYCTGNLNNNGIISMEGRSPYLNGENIYVYKDKNGKFDVINANGRKYWRK